MWMTCALVAALSTAPAQGNGLKVTNIRATNGILGSERKSNDVLPGDLYYLAFDIDGLTIKADGETNFRMTVELIGKNSKVIYSDAQKVTVYATLGGKTVPGAAHCSFGIDVAKGEYTFKVTVADLSAAAGKKVETSFERKVNVLEKGFGIVRPQLTQLSGRSQTAPSAPIGIVGTRIIANAYIVGIKLNDKKKSDLKVEFQVLDADGKAVSKGLSQTFTDIANEFYDVHWPMTLNRAGKFTVKLKVTDGVAKKTEEFSWPLQVLDVK